MIKLIEVNLSDLEGRALDWLVAQVEGIAVTLAPPHYGTGWRVFGVTSNYAYRPSTDWSLGGPLMDKYAKGFAAVSGREPPQFRVFARDNGPEGFCRLAGGATILQAFCRALVRLHRGDLVMVPEVLVLKRECRTHAARYV